MKTLNDLKQEEHFEFWKHIIYNEDGSLNEEQVLKELYDFSDLIDRHVKVVCELTGHTLSYASYPAETVISVAEDYNTRVREEYLLDVLQDAVSLEVITNEQANQIKEELL